MEINTRWPFIASKNISIILLLLQEIILFRAISRLFGSVYAWRWSRNYSQYNQLIFYRWKNLRLAHVLCNYSTWSTVDCKIKFVAYQVYDRTFGSCHLSSGKFDTDFLFPCFDQLFARLPSHKMICENINKTSFVVVSCEKIVGLKISTK